MSSPRLGRTITPIVLITVALLLSPDGAASAQSRCDDEWTIVESPSPGTILNSLGAVAAVSATDAWAVGFEGHVERGEFVEDPLIEHWDGRAWTVARVPDVHGLLADVAAVASDDVWAVGQAGSEDESTSLTLHWDGRRWSAVRSPIVARGYLLDVSATGPEDVWAVGVVTGTFETIVEHWDGTAWRLVSHPSPRSDYVNLGSVLAVAADDVWMAGNFLDANAADVPFSERWDGRRWRPVPMVNEGGGTLINALTMGQGSVWAVGRARVDDFSSVTVAERWDGNAWTVDATPTPGGSGELLGATSAGPHLWAVGWSQEEQGATRTLTLRRGPNGWKVMASPNPSDLGNLLLAVAASADGDLWAVGFSQEPGVNRTLTMHRCPD
ncbi:MAG TPA: hypothetical protein VKA30_09155 [Actinomycetota bacterium]|nr:hypothetical protein [Actinomycetota bacterium]